VNNHTNDIASALLGVRAQIDALASAHGRNPQDISLLAVSKTKPAEQIQAAFNAGQRAFGENYADEAIGKIAEINHTDCEWHFIGAIQSRKCADIAQHFSWVHSVDRIKVAKKLSERRPSGMPPVQICIQVNIDNEPSKSGVLANDVEELADAVADLPGISLRGLMAIPSPQTEFARQRMAFEKLRKLLETTHRSHPSMDTLSMGMSGDLEAAIAEGATIVRVGTAIFGARKPRMSE